MAFKIEKNIPAEWELLLQNNIPLRTYTDINKFLLTLVKAGKNFFPDRKYLFNSLSFCSPQNVDVVIVGQDPYHSNGQANGLAFSVNKDIKLPPSLRNIFQELHSDLGIKKCLNGNLEPWAKQGVLLLNSILSVEESKPGSHHHIGWEVITNCILKNISLKERIVFILWGEQAQKKEAIIHKKNNLIIKSSHPSPLSAYRGFYGSKPFSKTNEFLKLNGKRPINWDLEI